MSEGTLANFALSCQAASFTLCGKTVGANAIEDSVASAVSMVNEGWAKGAGDMTDLVRPEFTMVGFGHVTCETPYPFESGAKPGTIWTGLLGAP